MPLVSGRLLFEKANEFGFAIGGFNFHNMEFLKAILDVAEEEEAPVFLQTTETTLRYTTIDLLAGMVHSVKDRYRIPFALHLDHGKSVETISSALRHGYTSVMIDLSHRPYEENLEITRRVVSMCTPMGVSVEAELGRVEAGSEYHLTDPQTAKEFALRTGITALAPAIGTAHGVHKSEGKPELDFERLREIKTLTNMPLVLHGSSSVYYEYVTQINTYGGEIKKAVGISEDDIRRSIDIGVNKINTDTDLRLAFISAIRRILWEDKTLTDPRKVLKPAIEEVKEIVRRRIRLYRSYGTARLFG